MSDGHTSLELFFLPSSIFIYDSNVSFNKARKESHEDTK